MRFWVVSFEASIADIEEAKAWGSLRLLLCLESFVSFGFEGWEVLELVEESESESEADELGASSDASFLGGGECGGVAFEPVSASLSESARFTARSSSSFSEDEAEGDE